MRVAKHIIGKAKVIIRVTEETETLKLCALFQPEVKKGDIITDYDGDICFFRPTGKGTLINITYKGCNKRSEFFLKGNSVIEIAKKPIYYNATEIQNKEQLKIAKIIDNNAKIGSFIIKDGFRLHHVSFEEFMEKFTTLPKKLRKQKIIPPTV